LGLLDVLRGQRTPRRPDLDRIFGISSAAVALQTSLDLTTTGRAGVCFRAVEAGAFAALVADTDQLLQATSGESGTTVSRHEDDMGFSWVVIDDPDVDDLATTAHVVCQSLEERGFSEQLLCAVFGFDGAPGRVELVYAYKRGSFYPFAPREGRTRDLILERRVQSVLQHEVALEPEMERWYPVWDAPVAPG